MFPYILCGIFIIISIILLIKVLSIQKGINEICSEFGELVAKDTNGIITLSCKDACVRKLANEINEQLKSLQKLSQQYSNGDAELKEAITNISHDLRTPLTAICGYLDLLEGEEKSADAERYLSIISGRAKALNSLTEELFRYSIDVSSDNFELKQVDVGKVLEESLLSSYSLLKERNIEPQISISENKITKSLNEEALSRIFSNIISNAVKYSDGDLTVQLLDSGKVIFSNHASNLDKLSAQKLFNRFFTVESGRQSTGLGLSIAKLLTEKMNGKIWADYDNGIISICIIFN